MWAEKGMNVIHRGGNASLGAEIGAVFRVIRSCIVPIHITLSLVNPINLKNIIYGNSIAPHESNVDIIPVPSGHLAYQWDYYGSAFQVRDSE
jgi:hypothetical protein